MKVFFVFIFVTMHLSLISSEINTFFNVETPQNDERRIEMIVDIIDKNLKTNGWLNILCLGHLPNKLYIKLQHLSMTFAISDIDHDDHEIEEEDITPYHSNFVVLSCLNFNEFEAYLTKATQMAYFHPHSNFVLYYHATEEGEVIAKIFYILWYYKIVNAVIVQYDNDKESLIVSHYSPYVNDNYRLDNSFGCWTTNKIGMPIEGFEAGFTCEEGCRNVSLHSVYRASNLGACIGFNSHVVYYDDFDSLRKLNLFEDKGNLQGYTLRAYCTEVLPFLEIHEESNGTYSLHARDGFLWNTISKLMNFSIDLSPSMRDMKKKFDFELNIQQVFNFAYRKADLFLIPIYQMDLVIVALDQTMAFKDSGVCIMSYRAAFETVLFDMKLLQENYEVVIRFVFCFLFTWFVFFLFNSVEQGQFHFGQAGKDFLNTIRNILSISLYKPPKKKSFRIFLTVSIWSFFVINFANQATIISFFTAHKKGKEVDTFEDVIEKGYFIEGMASPDVVLPDTEEIFKQINYKFVPIRDLFDCVNRMVNDSRRFCLIDCAVGRYLERNRLNEKGEQYFHIATKDKIHSHYLNVVFPKFSPMTDPFNKYIMKIFEAGIITKWEQYRYNDIKIESPIKALNMEDLFGIFKCYCLLLGLSVVVFIVEIIIRLYKRFRRYFGMKLGKWQRTRIVKKALKLDREQSKIKHVTTDTQTI